MPLSNFTFRELKGIKKNNDYHNYRSRGACIGTKINATRNYRDIALILDFIIFYFPPVTYHASRISR